VVAIPLEEVLPLAIAEAIPSDVDIVVDAVPVDSKKAIPSDVDIVVDAVPVDSKKGAMLPQSTILGNPIVP
jgi:hypothetical protein